jgi:hypothetical protein
MQEMLDIEAIAPLPVRLPFCQAPPFDRGTGNGVCAPI